MLHQSISLDAQHSIQVLVPKWLLCPLPIIKKSENITWHVLVKLGSK